MSAATFVRAEGPYLMLGGRPYRFLGVNLWQGHNLASEGPGGDRARLVRELDRLAALGVTNVRIMGGSEGPASAPHRVTPPLQPAPGLYDKALLDGLDFLLYALGERSLKAVVCLNNYWFWSGGLAQYVAWTTGDAIPYPSTAWTPDEEEHYMRFTSHFYDLPAAQRLFLNHIDTLLQRTNPYTGRAYAEEPTVMAWQLANEPRGAGRPDAMRRWIDETSAFIKERAPHHLVSTGSEGDTAQPRAFGLDFEQDQGRPGVDYLCAHVWAQNWGWYDPARPEQTFEAAQARALAYVEDHLTRAEALGKPLVLEEFGFPRDGGRYDARAPTTSRDAYFRALFEAAQEAVLAGRPLAGLNLWAWSGAARPHTPGTRWRPGDAFTGDPPHEPQGWYSLYDTDTSTLALIETYARLLSVVP